MGLIGDALGAFGISNSGIMAGALKMVGVPEKAAEAAAFAYELSRGMTKDGFDLDKVNKGALARHALRAFGNNSPMAALGVTAALNIMPKGFLSGGGGGGGGIGSLLGGLAGPALAATAMGGLMNMQGGIGALLGGLLGGGTGGSVLGGGLGAVGLSTSDVAGGAMKFAFGNNTAQVRQQTGLTRANYGPGSMLANLPRPAMFEDIVAAFMIDVVKDKQEKIEERLRKLEDTDNSSNSGGSATGQAAGAVGGARGNEGSTNGNSDSRNIEFEIIKNEIQKLTQMQQAMSNVLNTMNDQAMNSIRHIKAG